MKITVVAAILQALSVQGIRIVHSNDDGWAEHYARALHTSLTKSGHDVLLSAPADNQSGTGSNDVEPGPRSEPCEYDSCSGDNKTIGFNETSPELNWVNSYPVTSMRYGIHRLGPNRWNGQLPELAVSGPNVGANLWGVVNLSGTVGAACYAANGAGIPALAFSGASNTHAAWNEPAPAASSIYAELATKLTNKVIAWGKPYLPNGIFLNVNFPKVDDKCSSVDDFEFVLSRIYPGLTSPPDVEWCGSNRLPTETAVHQAGGCYVSVSIGDAADKTTANDNRQDAVLETLKDMLVCLP